MAYDFWHSVYHFIQMFPVLCWGVSLPHSYSRGYRSQLDKTRSNLPVITTIVVLTSHFKEEQIVTPMKYSTYHLPIASWLRSMYHLRLYSSTMLERFNTTLLYFQPSCWMPWHLMASWCTSAQLRARSSTHSGGVCTRTWASRCAITSSPLPITPT